MEAIIFVGLQAAGKTTFYRVHFATSHVRVSLDELKTRARERAVIDALLDARLSFVVDNTNPAARDRARYIAPAKLAGYTITGYFFEPDIAGCLQRNALRTGKARIPVPGLFGTRKRLEHPTLAEGFDTLWTVGLEADGRFTVSAA